MQLPIAGIQGRSRENLSVPSIQGVERFTVSESSTWPCGLRKPLPTLPSRLCMAKPNTVIPWHSGTRSEQTVAQRALQCSTTVFRPAGTQVHSGLRRSLC